MIQHLLGLCECHTGISVVFLAIIIKTIINEPNRDKRILPINRNN